MAGVASFASAEFISLAKRTTEAPSATEIEIPDVTAVTNCHMHDTDVWCQADGTEFSVQATPTVASSFTDCHSHGSEMYCVDASGEDVYVDLDSAGGASHSGDGHGDDAEADGGEQHCHEHAGIPHCVGGGASEEIVCDAVDREYNVNLRVGLLFAIFVTSAMGVFGPIFIYKFVPRSPVLDTVFTVIKQFGTGIIISTAFVHLYSHATMMFANECVGDLGYEGTTSAIVMAGLFLSFLVEYIGSRIVVHKTRKMSTVSVEDRAKAVLQTEIVSILVMEAGIIFHSLLIGLTLVVSSDSFVMTLFVVILFHQVFEGLALGSRIATVGACNHPQAPTPAAISHNHQSGNDNGETNNKTVSTEDSSNSDIAPVPLALPMSKKLSLAALFSFVTPLGMAIGIGVLSQFNGRDRSTLIAIGTLDAVSAGILVWVGVVEMWAADWMTGAHGRKAELAEARPLVVALAMFGLISGLVVMSVLGKWA
ncbi:ZIP zinc transporter domain-containing protein [Sarocladium implicatum]|nr:ZIP zinc transporter domain-containing protein [Sarocladium implicatum]